MIKRKQMADKVFPLNISKDGNDKLRIVIYNNFTQIFRSMAINCSTQKNFTFSLEDNILKESLFLLERKKDGSIQNKQFQFYSKTDYLDEFQKKKAIVLTNYGNKIYGEIKYLNDVVVDIMVEKIEDLKDEKNNMFFREKINVGKINRLKYNNIEFVSESYNTNTIKFEINNLTTKLSLAYLIKDFVWKPNYTVLIDRENNLKSIKLTGEIISPIDLFHLNGYSKPFDVVLMAGDFTFPTSRYISGSKEDMGVVKSMSFSELNDKEGGNSEIKSYDVKSNLEKDGHDFLPIEEILLQNLGIISPYYFHDVYNPKTVNYGYLIKSPKYLPRGNVIFYSDDLEYLGYGNIEETLENEQVELMVGSSRVVKAITHITKSRKTIKHTDDTVSDEEITPSTSSEETNVEEVISNTYITNLTDRNQKLIVRIPYPNGNIIKIEPKNTRIYKNFIEFWLDIEPTNIKEDKIHFTVTMSIEI